MDLLCVICWMKETTLDKTRKKRTHVPLHIQVLTLERKSSFKYLGVHINEVLSQLWLRNFDT